MRRGRFLATASARPFPPSVSSVSECSDRSRFLLFFLAASAAAAAAASWAAAAERRIAGSSFLYSELYQYNIYF